MGSLSRYDRFFGGTPGAAEQTQKAMQKTYGRKDGETVFWATIAKRKRRSSTTKRRRK